MRNRSTEDSKIIVDYYIGAYAPTIRLDVQSLTRLHDIKRVFLSLGEESEEEINFTQLEKTETSGLHALILKFVPDSRAIKKNLVLVENDLQRVDFLWVGDSEHWQRCAALVEALIESNEAGHQYLTAEGADDALIELAYRE